MSLIRKLPVVLATVFLFTCHAHADSIWGEFDAVGNEDVPLKEGEKRFGGRVQAGYIAARGNSNTTNFNGKVVMGIDQMDWRHAWIAAGIYSKDETTVIAENYRAGYKADRKLDGQNYLFLALSWEQNEFAGYDQRTSEAIGYGRRMFDTDTQRLDLEVGLGARQTELVDGSDRDETIGRLALSYFWDFGEHSDFSHQMALETGDFNTYFESVTSVSSQLIGELDLVASYTVKRNSTVPAGREKMDTYTTISVRYNF